ncbi:MAG: CvpA family protein [Alphaproteobacteria bacterium]
MNNLDIIILFIVAISALMSISRGFIREVLSIVGWVVGSALVVTFLPIVMPFSTEHITDETTAKIITSVGIFGAFMLFWMFFSSGTASKIKASKLGNIDKVLGLFFGLFRAFLLIILVYILVGLVYPKEEMPKTFKESKYFTIAGSFAEPIQKLIPKSTFEKLKKSTEDKQEEIKKEVNEKVKETIKEEIEKETEEKQSPENIGDLISDLGLE